MFTRLGDVARVQAALLGGSILPPPAALAFLLAGQHWARAGLAAGVTMATDRVKPPFQLPIKPWPRAPHRTSSEYKRWLQGHCGLQVGVFVGGKHTPDGHVALVVESVNRHIKCTEEGPKLIALRATAATPRPHREQRHHRCLPVLPTSSLS